MRNVSIDVSAIELMIINVLPGVDPNNPPVGAGAEKLCRRQTKIFRWANEMR